MPESRVDPVEPGWWLAADGKWYPPEDGLVAAPGWRQGPQGSWIGPKDDELIPSGWWLGADGHPYPPTRHPRPSPASAPSLGDSNSRRRRIGLSAVTIVQLLAVYGVLFFVFQVVKGSGLALFLEATIVIFVSVLVLSVLMTPLTLHSMRASPLSPVVRSHLRSLAEKSGVRVRDFLQYQARGRSKANAVQVGALPTLRYVLVSQVFVDNFPSGELDAVVAHELSHARRWDGMRKIGAYSLILGGYWTVITDAARNAQTGVDVVPLLLLPLSFPFVIIGVQGLIGVRLEERADDFAAKTVGSEQIASALERLAQLNNVKAKSGSFRALLTQHPAIDKRIRRLRGERGASTRALHPIMSMVVIAVPVAALIWLVAVPEFQWHPAAVDVTAAQQIALQASDLPADYGFMPWAQAVDDQTRNAPGPCTTLSSQPWLADVDSAGYSTSQQLALFSTVVILPSASDAENGINAMRRPSFGIECESPSLGPWVLQDINCPASRISSAVQPFQEPERSPVVGWVYSESYKCPGSTTSYSGTVVVQWEAVGPVAINLTYSVGSYGTTLFFAGAGNPLITIGNQVLAHMESRALAYTKQSADRQAMAQS